MEPKPYLHNAKYYETDQMAIVHHSNYIRWFEEARIDWLEQIGIPYSEMEARGILIPVVEVSARYRAVTRFQESVTVRVRLERYNGVRFSFQYEVRDAADGTLRCTGRSEHCFMDRTYRPVILRRKAPDYHARLLEALEGQDITGPEGA